MRQVNEDSTTNFLAEGALELSSKPDEGADGAASDTTMRRSSEPCGIADFEMTRDDPPPNLEDMAS